MNKMKFGFQILVASAVVWLLTIMLFTDSITFKTKTAEEPASTEPMGELVDGTYHGSATGHNGGPLEVEVVVENNEISDVKVLNHTESDGIADPALEQVPAAIIEANSTDVDTVSGATVTSQTIINAVNNALAADSDDTASTPAVVENETEKEVETVEETDDTEEEVETEVETEEETEEVEDETEEVKEDADDTAVYTDGVYTAETDGHNDTLAVEVEVADGVIASVKVTDHKETDGLADDALKEVPQAIVDANSPDVDTISGATVTSQAIIDAVALALEDATETEAEETADVEVMYEDGTYTAEVDGAQDKLEVEVTIKDNKIENVEVIKANETEGIAEPAIEELPKEIVKANSTEVEVVSGATLTSKAIIEAVNKALEEAKVTEAVSDEDVTYKDGTYEGKAEGHNAELVVKVTIKDGKIESIKPTSHKETDGLADKAFDEVLKAIVETNSTEDIDVASGATVTSNALIEAVNDALNQAK